jgi:hypothetical protein
MYPTNSVVDDNLNEIIEKNKLETGIEVNYDKLKNALLGKDVLDWMKTSNKFLETKRYFFSTDELGNNDHLILNKPAKKTEWQKIWNERKRKLKKK